MRFLRRLLGRKQVYVHLQYEDGRTALLGPMDHFAAEVLIVQRINPYPYHNQRRVRSARIVEQ